MLYEGYLRCNLKHENGKEEAVMFIVRVVKSLVLLSGRSYPMLIFKFFFV